MAQLLAQVPQIAELRTSGYVYDFEGLIDIPDAETSAGWTDSIPTTYDGHGKKAVYWDGHLWVLNDTQEQEGVKYYIWIKLPNIIDTSEIVYINVIQNQYVQDYFETELTLGEIYDLVKTQGKKVIARLKNYYSGIYTLPSAIDWEIVTAYYTHSIYTSSSGVNISVSAIGPDGEISGSVGNPNTTKLVLSWSFTGGSYAYRKEQVYNKSEINAMIGDIETLLSQI